MPKKTITCKWAASSGLRTCPCPPYRIKHVQNKITLQTCITKFRVSPEEKNKTTQLVLTFLLCTLKKNQHRTGCTLTALQACIPGHPTSLPLWPHYKFASLTALQVCISIPSFLTLGHASMTLSVSTLNCACVKICESV